MKLADDPLLVSSSEASEAAAHCGRAALADAAADIDADLQQGRRGAKVCCPTAVPASAGRPGVQAIGTEAEVQAVSTGLGAGSLDCRGFAASRGNFGAASGEEVIASANPVQGEDIGTDLEADES